MPTIQIVKNSDRVHVTIDGVPVKTFMFGNYVIYKKQINREGHAIYDAMAECFIRLAEFQKSKIDAKINAEIIVK